MSYATPSAMPSRAARADKLCLVRQAASQPCHPWRVTRPRGTLPQLRPSEFASSFVPASSAPITLPSLPARVGLLPFASRAHSRNSSYSALPPSPRVPLRQWAERTASLGPDDVGMGLGRRTGSERGSRRTASQAGGGLRRGQSVSFDEGAPSPRGGGQGQGQERPWSMVVDGGNHSRM